MRRLESLLFPPIMAGIMSFVMSGIIIAINLGVTERFLSDWMGAWSVSLPIALVGTSLAAPVAKRITRAIVAVLPRRPSGGRA